MATKVVDKSAAGDYATLSSKIQVLELTPEEQAARSASISKTLRRSVKVFAMLLLIGERSTAQKVDSGNLSVHMRRLAQERFGKQVAVTGVYSSERNRKGRFVFVFEA